MLNEYIPAASVYAITRVRLIAVFIHANNNEMQMENTYIIPTMPGLISNKLITS